MMAFTIQNSVAEIYLVTGLQPDSTWEKLQNSIKKYNQENHGEFMRGVYRGTDNMIASFGGAVDAAGQVLQDAGLGGQGLSEWGNNVYQNRTAKADLMGEKAAFTEHPLDYLIGSVAEEIFILPIPSLVLFIILMIHKNKTIDTPDIS